jgi:hypothetical protein
MKRLFLFLFIAANLLSACGETPRHTVDFYCWKTNTAIDSIEQTYFNALGAQKLYVRFFDVDKNAGGAFANAQVKPFDVTVLHAEYVPVVFITNRTFVGATREDALVLAKKVAGLVKEIEETLQMPPSVELQMDCDWTASTRAAYFAFLQALGEVSGRKISGTLRLHQLKYQKQSGIPPLAKVYLMCYATSDPADKSERNSILDMNLLKDYTQNIAAYPLPLDVALPLYSWGVAVNQLGKIKLLNGLTHEDMQPPVFRQMNENTYEVTADCFLQGLYLNKGFTVRIESVDAALLQAAKQHLDKKLHRNYNIVYYHLDKIFLKKFTFDELK